MLYIANLEPGQVLGLNAKNGVQRWKRALPGRTESSPVVVDDKRDRRLRVREALRASTRTPARRSGRRTCPGEVKAAPAVSDGVAYVGDYSGTMSAVRVNDGSIKWQSGSQGGSFGRPAPSTGPPPSRSAASTSASKDGRVYSFEKETGDLAWSQTTGGEVYAGVVAADTPKTEPDRLLRLLRRQPLLRARRPSRARSAGPSTPAAR